jgi:hypothetical protein
MKKLVSQHKALYDVVKEWVHECNTRPKLLLYADAEDEQIINRMRRIIRQIDEEGMYLAEIREKNFLAD